MPETARERHEFGLRLRCENGQQAFLRLPGTPVRGICCGREECRREAGRFDVGGEEVKSSALHGFHIQRDVPGFRHHQDVDGLAALAASLRMS